MTILTLVRHAKASSTFAGLDDWARPLDRRGMQDALAMRELFSDRLSAPDLILTSDAARAMQTCEVLVDALQVDAARVRPLHDLYLATDEAMLTLLEQHFRGVEHVLVVAHNPGLTELYNRIVSEPIDSLPTLAVASIEVPGRRWTGGASGSGRVLDYFTPETIRAR